MFMKLFTTKYEWYEDDKWMSITFFMHIERIKKSVCLGIYDIYGSMLHCCSLIWCVFGYVHRHSMLLQFWSFVRLFYCIFCAKRHGIMTNPCYRGNETVRYQEKSWLWFPFYSRSNIYVVRWVFIRPRILLSSVYQHFPLMLQQCK